VHEESDHRVARGLGAWRLTAATSSVSVSREGRVVGVVLMIINITGSGIRRTDGTMIDEF
jgi:hypothetical protein